MWFITRIAVVAAFIGILPLAAMLFSLLLAEVIGCPVHEGGSVGCTVFGLEIGWFISWLRLTGLVSAVFLAPPAAALVLAWALIEIVNLIRNR